MYYTMEKVQDMMLNEKRKQAEEKHTFKKNFI